MADQQRDGDHLYLCKFLFTYFIDMLIILFIKRREGRLLGYYA